MKGIKSILIVLFFISLTIGGCASMSDVLKSKDDGTAISYPVNQDQAWDIAMTVLRWEGCETIEEHKSQGYMLTTVGQNFISAGSLIGVWIDKIDTNNSKVTIVSKRKVQTNIATGLTEGTFQKRFAQAVEIVNSGQKLPIEAPPYKTE
ncbi:MAG TPA: hypothetical protein VKA26_14810 [Ignavibacteriaceae bacterium]|nr:hypothetical protein [Ignavibacteriaceae bacterium]